jgi:hypothetical protein
VKIAIALFAGALFFGWLAWKLQNKERDAWIKAEMDKLREQQDGND